MGLMHFSTIAVDLVGSQTVPLLLVTQQLTLLVQWGGRSGENPVFGPKIGFGESQEGIVPSEATTSNHPCGD